MSTNNDEKTMKKACSLLQTLTKKYLIISYFFNTISIYLHPSKQKYRVIKTTNKTLKKKLFSCKGADTLLETLGFILVEGSYTLHGDSIKSIVKV